MAIPTGRVVAVYRSYSEAEQAVDRLSDAGFAVERTAIIGRNPQFVERVVGRVGYLDAALRGGVTGAIVGILIGWLFAVFNWFDPSIAWGWLVFDGLWFGLLAGTLAGLLGHALSGGRRDFDSVRALEADRYELLVDEEVADEAERILGIAAPAETAHTR
jgi:hypothetical protein